MHKKLFISLLLSLIIMSGPACNGASEIKTTDAPATSAKPSHQITTSKPQATTEPVNIPFIPTDLFVEYIRISPQTTTVTAGDRQKFTVMAYTNVGDEAYDVTWDSQFSIEDGAGGYWVFNEYVSENPGEWEVEAFFEGPSDGFAWWTDFGTIIVKEPDNNTGPE